MAVFVLDRHSRPLMPCSEKRARLLLERRRARVHRLVPFTIRLTDRRLNDCELQPLRLKLDPGSKETGVAIVREAIHDTDGTRTAIVLSLAEIVHRGRQISEALTARRSIRRARRGRRPATALPASTTGASQRAGLLRVCVTASTRPQRGCAASSNSRPSPP